MTTTLEKFAGAKSGNYCTLPTIDVEVLDEPYHCEECGGDVDFISGFGSFGTWIHHDGHREHKPTPRMRCRYCGGDEPGTVTFTQEAWFDATRCARCGGVEGYAIGD